MTVLELINKLLHLPPDAEVLVTEYQGCLGSSVAEVFRYPDEDGIIHIRGIE